MFGLFKKKPAPEGPVEIVISTKVEAPAQDFYALIDFADPRNAKRELGHEVRETGDGGFVLVMNFLPDCEFPIEVTAEDPPRHYAYRSVLPPGLGKLQRTHERYDIEPVDDRTCEVTMRIEAEFQPGMTLSEFDREMTMVTLGSQNALAKLKVHAEGGIESVREFEVAQAS